MTFIDFVVQLIASGFVGLGGGAFIVWLTKSWISERIKNSIKAEYDTKLESHKAQLKAVGDVELERLRSQLALEAKEHDIVFSKLHEKRGEVIAEIYAKLKEVQFRLEDYTKAFEPAGDKPRAERFKLLADSQREFVGSFTGAAIFLPANVAKAIDELNRIFVMSGTEFQLIDAHGAAGQHDKWMEINKRTATVIPEALKKLEKELRTLLGYKGDALGE